MYEDTKTIGLHLPSLSIRGFRGINRLDIERLGRVTEADLENAATQGIEVR